MINKQANILFIPTSIGGNSAEPQDAPSPCGYYQQLIYASLARSRYAIDGLQILGRQLAAMARHACLTKDMHTVEQASQLMLALPISNQLESVARHYQALCTWREGDTGKARQSLERVVEEASPQYRARALQILGLTYHGESDLAEALRFYLAAAKAAANCDPATLIESQRTTAAVRGSHGDHKQALADLERLFPLVRAIGKYFPVLYYEFLNSLAVELGEVGRVPEAECALSISLASPFAAAYPEWSETHQELEAKRTSATPSIVAFSRVTEPEASPQIQSQRQPQPSRALNLTRATKSAKTARTARDKASFQRSVTLFPAKATSAFRAVSILDRMLDCIGPRAPPRPH